MPGPPGMALVLTEEWLTKYAMKEQVSACRGSQSRLG